MTKEQREQIAQLIRLEAKRELSRRFFWEFCKFYDSEFFSKRPFLKEIADAFQAVHDNYINGKAIRVSISMPPRAGKSYVTSLFCAWWLGKFPELSVMRNSCTDTLFCKLSYDVRNIVKSDIWKGVFKHELAEDKQNVHGWNLKQSKQVGYFGAGVGGTIIGFGANIAISDDLYRGIEDATSEVYGEKVHRWKESSHDSRMEKNCPEIFIGTRWSKSDVIGKAIESGDLDIKVVIPALNKEDKSFCENVKSTEEYHIIRNRTDKMIWLAEYQQEPIDAEGSLFNEKELRYFRPDKNRVFDGCLAYVDVADQGDDYLSMPVCQYIGTDMYITHWLHTQEGSEITEGRVAEILNRLKAEICQIEANNAGHIYARNVDSLCKVTDIETITNSTNKHSRIMLLSGFIKKHFIFLHPDFWDDEYRMAMKHLTGYNRKKSANKFDDSPDAATGLARLIVYYLEDNFESDEIPELPEEN